MLELDYRVLRRWTAARARACTTTRSPGTSCSVASAGSSSAASRKVAGKYDAVLSNEDVNEIFGDMCFNLLRDDMRKLRAYDPARGAKLGSWLGLLAINTAYDYLRQTSRRPLLDRLDGAPERAGEDPSALDDLLEKERWGYLNALLADFSRARPALRRALLRRRPPARGGRGGDGHQRQDGLLEEEQAAHEAARARRADIASSTTQGRRAASRPPEAPRPTGLARGRCTQLTGTSRRRSMVGCAPARLVSAASGVTAVELSLIRRSSDSRRSWRCGRQPPPPPPPKSSGRGGSAVARPA